MNRTIGISPSFMAIQRKTRYLEFDGAERASGANRIGSTRRESNVAGIHSGLRFYGHGRGLAISWSQGPGFRWVPTQAG